MTRSWLGWAIYLACSWTWCIGMFLPVLLVRDYGIWGWVVFAVPNVIGAAAMGWVIRSPAISRQIVQSHRPACAAFSIVTIAFHLNFALMIIDYLFGGAGAMTFALCLVIVVIAIQMRGELIIALTTLACSIVAWIGAVVIDPHWRVGMTGNHSMVDLAMLAPLCAFGFFLCPYLDMTFHRARQENDGPASRGAFGVGFGVFFLAMIMFTLYYAPRLTGAVQASGDSVPPALGIFGMLIGAHMIIQSAFTVSIHGRQLRTAWRWFFAPIAILICIILPTRMIFPHAGLSVSEAGYRLFMSFYGLIFPAYVWICMIPGRGIAPPTMRQWLVWVIAILLASPMFWMGFIESKMIWLLPGLAIVLLARLADYARRPAL